ncbi:MAG: hypothetical protein EZS28_015128 [Streblomastix strix]|uniref:Flavodoxin-like domain-containing protein n=1 Tax=Streblomastix strix TaxID=222440 RepID=A0A5J4W3I1_9EUKA|nr:MAG: hypothetical protein EZS28_015128 [Streblomastix strix]
MSSSTRALIVYSSLKGHTKSAANILKEELKKAGYEVVIEEIQCAQVSPKNEQDLMTEDSFKKTVFEVKQPVNDPQQFGIVLFGGPVWWYHLIPSIDAWIAKAKFDKKSTFGTFQQCDSLGFQAAYADLEKLLGASVERTVIFDKDHTKDKGGIRDKLTQFAQVVVAAYKAKH